MLWQQNYMVPMPIKPFELNGETDRDADRGKEVDGGGEREIGGRWGRERGRRIGKGEREREREEEREGDRPGHSV